MLNFLFAARMCAVKAEGLPLLCKADEVGELVVCSVATGTSYYGLPGMTKTMFEVSVGLFFCAPTVSGPSTRPSAPAGVSSLRQQRPHRRASLHQDGSAGLHRTRWAHLCGGENRRLDGGWRTPAQCRRHRCHGTGRRAHEVRLQGEVGGARLALRDQRPRFRPPLCLSGSPSSPSRCSTTRGSWWWRSSGPTPARRTASGG